MGARPASLTERLAAVAADAARVITSRVATG